MAYQQKWWQKATPWLVSNLYLVCALQSLVWAGVLFARLNLSRTAVWWGFALMAVAVVAAMPTWIIAAQDRAIRTLTRAQKVSLVLVSVVWMLLMFYLLSYSPGPVLFA